MSYCNRTFLFMQDKRNNHKWDLCIKWSTCKSYFFHIGGRWGGGKLGGNDSVVTFRIEPLIFLAEKRSNDSFLDGEIDLEDELFKCVIGKKAGFWVCNTFCCESFDELTICCRCSNAFRLWRDEVSSNLYTRDWLLVDTACLLIQP